MLQYMQDIIHGWSFMSMILRLLIAMLTGMLIGIDREKKKRGAGVKTHALVCIGAALTMMTSEYIFYMFPEAKSDMSRLGAQVISGVGFLGVGTIIVTGKNQIKGLTTAAGLWASACIGLAIGIGFVEGAVLALCYIIFTLQILNRLDEHLRQDAKQTDYYAEFISGNSLSEFISFLRVNGMQISNLNIANSTIKGEGPTATFTINIKDQNNRSGFLDQARNCGSVKYIEELWQE